MTDAQRSVPAPALPHHKRAADSARQPSSALIRAPLDMPPRQTVYACFFGEAASGRRETDC